MRSRPSSTINERGLSGTEAIAGEFRRRAAGTGKYTLVFVDDFIIIGDDAAGVGTGREAAEVAAFERDELRDVLRGGTSEREGVIDSGRDGRDWRHPSHTNRLLSVTG